MPPHSDNDRHGARPLPPQRAWSLPLALLLSMTAAAIGGCPIDPDRSGAVIIPGTWTSIGGGGRWTVDRGFSWCQNLVTVAIPDSVTSIGRQAFIYCSNLATVDIPNSVTSIAQGAFFHSTSLATIAIPDSVTSIRSGAFGGCTSLVTVAIPNPATDIEPEAFRNCGCAEDLFQAGVALVNCVGTLSPSQSPSRAPQAPTLPPTGSPASSAHTTVNPTAAVPTATPTATPTADRNPSSTSKNNGMSETTEIAIIVAVAALVVCMIIAGTVLLAKSKAKGGDGSDRRDYDNPTYADDVVNNTSTGSKLAPNDCRVQGSVQPRS